MLTTSRVAAAIRRALLLLLVLLFAGLAPSVPGYHPHPAHAAGPGPEPLELVPDAVRQPPDLTPPTALHTRRDPVAFRDASARHRNPPAISTSGGILVDIDTNQVLWAFAPHARRAPASLTKIVAGYVALENLPPDRAVLVQPQATAVGIEETRMGLVAGEQLTVRELLSGMFTVSANDAALALAYGTTGMTDYVAAMNQQVTALGLVDSHFSGPVGYPDDPELISSAYDLAAIATSEYRSFPLFRELTASHDVLIPKNATHQEYKLHNINRMLEIYPPAVGTKSGFTDIAGPCLVSMAVRDNHHLVAVLLNSQHMFDQSRALLEWGFTQEGLVALYPPPPSPPATPAPVPARPGPR
ncbi:MAG: serine hydrolase [Candidatus Dormibacteraeota bacterium]|nr:serine hydrolase [Candidatus Dormibacteraeota bacterium]